MAASIFDSAIYRDLMLDREFGALFSDTAEVRAMMIVEGALAKAQGEVGLIPMESATAIHRASLELQIDPAGLSPQTGQNAVVIPALVAAFRTQMQAPEHSQWVHYGATSQDIIDTAQALRLRQMLALAETRLGAILAGLGALAEAHAQTPMAGRTYGQVATPTSFGSVVASWGAPLAELLEQLPALRARVLKVSLSGAAGTLSALGDKAGATRSELAKGLALGNPDQSWHSMRDGIAALAAWMTQVTAQIGKMGDDLTLMTQTGIGEIQLPASGGSSTMPQKQNPVMPSLAVSIGRTMVGLNSIIQGATIHRQQRDGAAWISEWMTLPQMCLGLGRSLSIAQELAEGISPRVETMAAHIDDGTGLIYAEALSFRLSQSMPRPQAQAEVKEVCKDVIAGKGSLSDLAPLKWPQADLGGVFAPEGQLGLAPVEARQFAARVKDLAN